MVTLPLHTKGGISNNVLRGKVNSEGKQGRMIDEMDQRESAAITQQNGAQKKLADLIIHINALERPNKRSAFLPGP